MRVSTWHKILAIKMALLPRALYASALTSLGDVWFTRLRSQIMKALRVNRSGANPVVRIGLITSVDVDPHFFDS